jgi:hypothetical protein
VCEVDWAQLLRAVLVVVVVVVVVADGGRQPPCGARVASIRERMRLRRFQAAERRYCV